MKVSDIRDLLVQKFINEDFVIDKTGVKTVEIIGCSFLADEDAIFGSVNQDYIKRELQWYESQSLYVKDIPGVTPKIWEQVSDTTGKINSNYGWCVFSEENGYQYKSVLNELQRNPNSRRAIMIYNRPSMHTDYNMNGMSDFMCCQNNAFFIRNHKLEVVVDFRSNDCRFGFLNDLAWIKYLHNKLAIELGVDTGNIHWNASSLHVYEKDFYLLDHFNKTGEITISKKEYIEELT